MGEGLTAGVVTSVNVGAARRVTAGGRTVDTGIWKAPVTGPVAARGVNLDGDEQADRQVHGGPDKAVYAYGIDDYAWWEHELGRSLGPGTFGENLTIEGLGVSTAVVGERWKIGSAEFEVCQPRSPCGKLGIRMGDPQFPRRFTRAGRPGAYLRIAVEGTVTAGDVVSVLRRPAHGVTVADVAEVVEGDLGRLPELLLVPELAATRVAWAVEQAVAALQRDPSDDRLRPALLQRLVRSGMDGQQAERLVDNTVAGR
ncbi:MAG: MOSC domain-containing protein [Actinomycetota bacterium]|nr:MOSC domain-containing protein [Actinomycetota bacterium]